MNREYTVVFIEGGLGKVVAATAAIRNLKKAYPEKKLIVVSGYPEVFDRNPHVFRTFGFNQHKYLYNDYVKNGTIFERDPYHMDTYRFDECHLAQAFCDGWGIEFDGDPKPEIYLDDAVISVTRNELIPLKEDGLPLIVVQYLGRSPVDQQSKTYIPTGRENLPLFEEVMNKLCGKVRMMVMKTPEEPTLKVAKNTVILNNAVHFSRWFGYMYNADGFLSIDSCSHHIAAAFNKPGVAVWGRTSEKNLGYAGQTNVLGTCEDRPCGGFMKVPAPGWECSHGFKCIKSVKADQIVDAVLGAITKNIKPSA